MAAKTRWHIRLLSAAAATAAAVCFGVRCFPLFNGEQAALATADLLLPKAAQEVYTSEENQLLIEEDELILPSATPSPVETPKATATPSPTPVPTPKPGTKATPIQESQVGGGTQYGDIFIKNSTGLNVDFAAEQKKESKLNLKADGTPMVLLYHTHTTESYLPEESAWFYDGTATRNQDLTQTVVMVGNAMEAELEAAGFGVIHDTTVHDYPSYNGGYARSLETMKKNLEKYPSIQITLDIHRDAIGGEDRRVKPTVTVDGKKAAQFMLIAGCDADGSLGFPNWKQNLNLALNLQQTAAEKFPGLARPLYCCNMVYNENLTPGSLLLECGTEVNTVEEAAYTGQLFGKILADTMRKMME